MIFSDVGWESEDERGEDPRIESVNLFLVTMNHNGLKLMARDGISYRPGDQHLTASQGFHSQVHNEKHFVRTMRGFKHITQISFKRKLDSRREER